LKAVQYIVFRYLTNSDFFNIYKPSGTEIGGGGQSYIDFKTGAISALQWQQFFEGVPSTNRRQGPNWAFKIHSIGLDVVHNLNIYQRRPQSFTISSQRITSEQSNRVPAWHPRHGFPKPIDPTDRRSCPPGLAIYIVRTTSGEYWAGWFQDEVPYRDQESAVILKDMIPDTLTEGLAGFITPTNHLLLDESDSVKTFFVASNGTITKETGYNYRDINDKKSGLSTKGKQWTEEEITKDLFDEDYSYSLEPEDKFREALTKIRTRNTKAVHGLKELYHGKCQITGEQYTFLKRDGTFYSEAHHLIPLGNAGADSPFNIIIVSPLIHRMLHFARVDGLDLSKITEDNRLTLSINDQPFTITWHPDHADHVRRHQDKQ
jgi:5-methylcytosine-specific restriction protein A